MLFIHPSSGSIGGFRRLLPHLAADYPVAAFEASGSGPADGCTVTELAEAYLAEAAEAAMADDATLVGWSFGGAVAVAMAELAERAGRPVRGVVLLDSATPEVLKARPRSTVEEYAGLFGVAPELLEGVTEGDRADRVLEAVARALSPEGGIPYTADDLRPYVELHTRHVRTLHCGPPLRPCTAPVTLVRAAGEQGWGTAPGDLGWSALLGLAVRTRWTPGTHQSMTEPHHAAGLAALLDELFTGQRGALPGGPPGGP
ncbi:thioesterase domain-containing protein [Streptomyces sp. NBC_00503]|uniref:thioesterase domain-containing protein n=1 Tax=Streptomyces sp. NBC_00503 TaxID=2903659 RepID=UPI002E814163|nr:alpha/beta fold hydrolase [Streptomyces sp. NBC_00503]WUD84114.1 alpha/beta fold hydrolase [Streptomyces sp. NBC_00503]